MHNSPYNIPFQNLGHCESEQLTLCSEDLDEDDDVGRYHAYQGCYDQPHGNTQSVRSVRKTIPHAL